MDDCDPPSTPCRPNTNGETVVSPEPCTTLLPSSFPFFSANSNPNHSSVIVGIHPISPSEFSNIFEFNHDQVQLILSTTLECAPFQFLREAAPCLPHWQKDGVEHIEMYYKNIFRFLQLQEFNVYLHLKLNQRADLQFFQRLLTCKMWGPDYPNHVYTQLMMTMVLLIRYVGNAIKEFDKWLMLGNTGNTRVNLIGSRTAFIHNFLALAVHTVVSGPFSDDNLKMDLESKYGHDAVVWHFVVLPLANVAFRYLPGFTIQKFYTGVAWNAIQTIMRKSRSQKSSHGLWSLSGCLDEATQKSNADFDFLKGGFFPFVKALQICRPGIRGGSRALQWFERDVCSESQSSRLSRQEVNSLLDTSPVAVTVGSKEYHIHPLYDPKVRGLPEEPISDNSPKNSQTRKRKSIDISK